MLTAVLVGEEHDINEVQNNNSEMIVTDQKMKVPQPDKRGSIVENI